MSSNGEIGAPFTLALLPRPLDSTSGRTQAASVCSISGSRKRKRTEVSVGIDGEGIFIYSLQNPQLVTSYAVPPQTSFTTAPCSIYRKAPSRAPSFRFTYVSTISPSSGEKPQLVCFAEEVKRDAAADTVRTAHTIIDRTDSIVSLNTLPTSLSSASKSSDHDVLAIFETGHALCLSADLATIRWEAPLETLSQSRSHGEKDIVVEHVTLATARQVLHGLLKGREDIAANLCPPSEHDSELLDLTGVLCVLSRASSNARALDLYQLRPRSLDAITSMLPPVQHLHRWHVPAPFSRSGSSTSKATYSLHAATGILHQLADQTLVSCDFSGTVPKVFSELSAPGFAIESFQRISSELVFAASSQSCAVFDVRYHSVQAVVSLQHISGLASPLSPSKKRKHNVAAVEGNAGHPTLVSYSGENGIIIALHNHELLGFQLTGTFTRKRRKAEHTRLVDSIGKGIVSGASGSFLQPSSGENRHDEWQKKVQKLDKYASKGKIAEFEKGLAKELNIEFVATSDSDGNLSNPSPTLNGVDKPLLTNGVHDDTLEGNEIDMLDAPILNNDHLPKWQLSQKTPDLKGQLHRQQALYALGKIFLFSKPGSSSKGQATCPLRVDFFPPNVFQWLLVSGQITKESIRRSILQNSTDISDSLITITDGDIVQAIADYDPDLHILSAVLNNSHFLPVGEVTQAIKVLLQSLDDRPKTDPGTKLLTNGVDPSEADMDLDLNAELEAASHDLDHALSMLDNGARIRSHTLRPALIRLHSFPAPTITAALRSTLVRKDLESLIRLLHVELKNGGWTSPYDFGVPGVSVDDLPPEDTDDHAVAIVASLLSCALDAIGTGAWLATVGGSNSVEAEELMKELHDQAQLAVEGFWESRYMRGLVSEFLRYAANLEKTQKPTNRSLQKQGKPFKLDAPLEDDLPMLPLGGKVDLGIERTKAGKGGKREERSAREIGMMISKRVPKYSFERIEL
ncbi:hypothetical protein EJ04DRAFT_462983 [Polyplosphaeria fusca]|uniref:Utp8 beta-propeller domain-containing protein n=1 Tax=Polyplosphaeria fusca TaxID=682080 RepID=A0A9P4QZ80_9PLEO|nr:hypothetical protein EJ04DRAFT_462983 [Polyplosphaeria fusca]